MTDLQAAVVINYAIIFIAILLSWFYDFMAD